MSVPNSPQLLPVDGNFALLWGFEGARILAKCIRATDSLSMWSLPEHSFKLTPPSKLFSGQGLSSFCKRIKRSAQKFEKIVSLKSCCLSLGRGGGLYKRTCLYSFDWNSSTHWLLYYCREITSDMHMASLPGKTPSRDQDCQVLRWGDLTWEAVLGLLLCKPSSFHSRPAQAVENQGCPLLRTHFIVCWVIFLFSFPDFIIIFCFFL